MFLLRITSHRLFVWTCGSQLLCLLFGIISGVTCLQCSWKTGQRVSDCRARSMRSDCSFRYLFCFVFLLGKLRRRSACCLCVYRLIAFWLNDFDSRWPNRCRCWSSLGEGAWQTALWVWHTRGLYAAMWIWRFKVAALCCKLPATAVEQGTMELVRKCKSKRN